MKEYQIYINGQWQDAKANEFSEVINPATEEVIAKVAKSNHEDVDDAVAAAKKAFPQWNTTSVEERAEYVEKILSGIQANRPLLEDTIIKELGSSRQFTESAQVSLAINEIRAIVISFVTFTKTVGST